ncbi:MAG: hypothetical protein ACK55I_26065, partial [bacterium]
MHGEARHASRHEPRRRGRRRGGDQSDGPSQQGRTGRAETAARPPFLAQPGHASHPGDHRGRREHAPQPARRRGPRHQRRERRQP